MLKKVSIKTINKNKTRKTLLNVFMLTFIMFVISMSTVYALSYTVSYNNNTGSGTMSDSTYTSNPGTLRTNTFTKSGYKFMGWNKNSSATSDWYRDTNSITGTDGSSITLYAQWCKVSNGTIKISNNEVKDTYGNYVFRNNKYITVKADNKTINYGATLTHSYTVTGTLLGESGVTGTASYTVKDGSNNTITTNPIPVGTYTIYVSGLSAGSGYVIQNTNTGTLTVNQTTCNAPTNVQVTTAGRVTWTSSSNCSSAQHQVSIDGTNWTNATSGYNYLSTIIAGTGTRTVRVRAVAPNNNYVTSSAATASATVYTITFASNDTNKGTVSPTSYNVISGATVEVSSNNLLVKGITSGSTTTTLATIVPTNKTGYHFDNWSKTSGSLTSTQTITATFVGNTYTATFYYQSNITSGSTTVTNTGSTYQCTVTSGSTCTVNIPDVVKNSVGTYNNAYAGLRTSYGASMTAQVTSDVATVTLSADVSYYSLYSSRVTIYKPSSTSACNSTNTIFYRNQWFTSNTTMGTTVLSTTTTGTSNNASYTSGVSEYSLYGFATAYGTNTRTYNDLNALKTSDATTVYAVLSKSITGTFYYNSNAEEGETTLSNTTASANQYLRCTSNSAAGISNSNFAVPAAVSSSVGTYNNAYAGVQVVGANNMTTITPTTANTSFYAIYRTNVTNYYWDSSSYASRTLYRNQYYASYNNVSLSAEYLGNTYDESCPGDTYDIGMAITIEDQGGPIEGVPIQTSDGTISYTDDQGYVVLNFTADCNQDNLSIGGSYILSDDNYPTANDDVSLQIGTISSYLATVLSTSTTGIHNYATATGPGSSSWDGLSTTSNAVADYPTVSDAANSTDTILYTIYKYQINYQKGSNVSSIGRTRDICRFVSATSGTTPNSCDVELPSITPNTGYSSVGWNTTNGATTGTEAGLEYTITNNSTTLYANAIPIEYTVSVNVTGATVSGNSNQSVIHGQNGQFTLVPSESEMFTDDPVCTNNQTATLSSSNVLTVSNVTSDTECTIHYYPVQTTFDYTGTAQDYTVPKTGYYYIEMAGGQGGNAWTSAGGNGYCKGGKGATTSGYIYLEEDTPLYFYVGGRGEDGASGVSYKAGGYNGGGNAGNGGTDDSAGGGGGATDVRLESGNWDDTSSLISRIMVASGGGGGSCLSNTSNVTLDYREGADLYNLPLTVASWAQTCALPSITETSGNAFGYGVSGINSVTNHGAGGGGGGYYGGSHCNGSNYYSGGQGGTSYISGYAGVDSVTESTTITHTGQTKHYSGKYFIGADMISGQNYNDGWAKISYVGAKPARRDDSLDDVRYIKDCTDYNTINAANHWSEIQAIKDGVNIAKSKTVTGTTSEASGRPYSRIVDGDLTPANWSNPSSAANNQCVTVDLGDTYDLDEVVVWNYFGDARRYINHDFQVSSDNSTWTNLSSDEVWLEKPNGGRFNAYIDHINGYRGRSALQWWLDGYANTGTTRSATVTTWKNLAGGVATNFANTKNGTAAGATWGSEFLTLDGTDDWVSVGAANYTMPTVEAVFNPSKTHTGESEIAVNFETGGYGLFLNANNALTASYYLDSAYRGLYSTNYIDIDKITNAATSFDEVTTRLYHNGTQIMEDDTHPSYRDIGLEQYTTSNPYTAGERDHMLGTEFDVTPGQTYRVYVTAKRTAGSLNLQGGIWYTELTSGTAYEGYNTGSFVLSKEIGNGWNRYYKDVTVPAGKSKGRYYIQLDQTEANGFTTTWLLADMALKSGIRTPDANTIMALGTNPTGSASSNGFLGGNIYSFRLYNRALSSEQLYRNYLYDKQRFHMRGETDPHDVKVKVTKGTVDMSTKTVNHNTTATFTITPNTGYGNPTISCTNGQTGSASGTTLTIGPVTADTTCTVTFTGCAKLAAGTYTAGSTISYGGKNYTVVADNGNNVSLAYNGTFGSGSYNNANTYLNTNFITADATLNEAKNNGCLIDQGSGAYATSNAGNVANKPAYEHWTGSGNVYIPNQVNTYSVSAIKYTAGMYNNQDLTWTSHNATISSSVRYNAGATATGISTSSSTITYTNGSYSSSTSGKWNRFMSEFSPDENYDGNAPTANRLPMARNEYYSGTYNGNWSYKTTKTHKISICGGTYQGYVVTMTAKSKTQYTYNHAGTGTSATYNYSANRYFDFAGAGETSTTGTANSNMVRTFPYATNEFCTTHTIYSLSSPSKTIYYRPLIKVKEA